MQITLNLHLQEKFHWARCCHTYSERLWLQIHDHRHHHHPTQKTFFSGHLKLLTNFYCLHSVSPSVTYLRNSVGAVTWTITEMAGAQVIRWGKFWRCGLKPTRIKPQYTFFPSYRKFVHCASLAPLSVVASRILTHPHLSTNANKYKPVIRQ